MAKKSKYDITVKSDLLPDDLLKLAATTVIRNKNKRIAIPFNTGSLSLESARKILASITPDNYWSIQKPAK